MKKFITVVFSFAIIINGFSQLSKDSVDLVQRLETFMKYNRELEFNKLMDYIYPKVFTIAPRDQMIQTMESAFKNPALGIKMDSLKIQKVYPVFGVGNNRYAKVSYSMQLLMTPQETDDSSNITMFLNLMQDQFGKENVRLDEKRKTLIIKQTLAMAAIKDETSKEWTFLNMKKDDPLIGKLLDKSVLDKLNSY